MKIFVAGATGAIGIPLTRRLVADGHDVTGMTRTPSKELLLRALGVEPVVCDVYDAAGLEASIVQSRPDVIIHQLTDLPDDLADMDGYLARNARIRREGTTNLLAAAKAAEVDRFLAQSVAWELPGDSGDAVAEHETAVLGAGGVVLRYGMLYGPGTYGGDEPPLPPRVHVDDAVRTTVEAMNLRRTVVTVVEDPANADLRRRIDR